MIRGRLLAALLWLSVLAPATVSPALATPCGAQPLARINVRDVYGAVVMQGKVGSQPVSLLLDSGGESGLLTEDAVRLLHLSKDASHLSLLRGTGGAGHLHRNVWLPSLQVGDLAMEGLSLPVGALPAFPNLQPPVIGLLGADILTRFDVALNLGRGEMTLYPPGACAGAAPWPDASAVPAQRSGPRLTVTAELDGQKLTALLDTGAHTILLSRRKAISLGALPAVLDGEPGGLSGGIDQPAVPFHWHRFASLKLGPDNLVDQMLTVMELNDVADMLIGSDWFAKHRVWISWADQVMWVSRNP